MRDIGSEGLDGVEPRPQRIGHRAQGTGEIADLVAATAEVGNLELPALARAHLIGGLGEAADRPRDGAGEVKGQQHGHRKGDAADDERSEEHTSELQSLMRISYAVFCLKKKKQKHTTTTTESPLLTLTTHIQQLQKNTK